MILARLIARPTLSFALLAASIAAGIAGAPQTTRAQTRADEHVWINLTTMGGLTDDMIYFAEIQPRFGDGASRVDQLLLRGAVGWKLSKKVSLYQGFAHIEVPTLGSRDINEERSFQQLNVALGKPLAGELTSRTRLEQRWRSDGGGVGWRLREMLRYEKPLLAQSNALNALVSTEAFIALNTTDWGARRGFDQLRTFVGAEVAVFGQTTAEIGYLNQAIDQPHGRTRINHAASISMFFRH